MLLLKENGENVQFDYPKICLKEEVEKVKEEFIEKIIEQTNIEKEDIVSDWIWDITDQLDKDFKISIKRKSRYRIT